MTRPSAQTALPRSGSPGPEEDMRFSRIGEYCRRVQDGGTFLVVTDDHVAPLYLSCCEESLRAAGFQTAREILPAGEASKNGENFLRLLSRAAQVPLTRTDGIVALGGGMVGDLAGFAAACYLRGIKIVQVPTTLLSAVDSSVGGKTAIDLPEGKNLAGAFHQPVLIVQDSSLLDSLPEDVYRAGMAEVIKAGVIADESLFEDLRDPVRTRREISGIIRRAVGIKQRFVEEDEFDTGIRHMLNFGHTIGHAVEKLSGFRVSHGDAVAKGMNRMAEISFSQGWCSAESRARLRAILESYGFDLSIPFSAEDLFAVIGSDKKRTGGEIRIVTLKEIGSCEIRKMPLSELRGILQTGQAGGRERRHA